MRTFSFARLSSFLLISALFVLPPTIHAQKLPRNVLRALQAQEAAELTNLTKGAIYSNASFRAALQGGRTAESLRAARKLNNNHPTSQKQRREFISEKKLEAVQLAIEKEILQPIPPTGPLSYKDLPFDPYEKIKQIVQGEKDPLTAFEIVKQLEDFYPGYSFFSTFAAVYYHQNFSILTSHLKQLFRHVARLNNPELERKLIERMVFLAENKYQLRDSFFPHIHQQGIRLRYIKNISELTPSNFDPRNLVLSFEQKMHPKQKTFLIGHIHAGSVFTAHHNDYPIYQYDGPFEYLPILYSYLLNGNNPNKNLTVFLDKKSKSMAIYNKQQNVWMRLSDHEYADSQRLHLHLNEFRTGQVITSRGEPTTETVNFNLSIPISTPANLPAQDQTEFLYNEMILKPISYLKQNPHVQVFEQSIF